jgi:hypothetical protein
MQASQFKKGWTSVDQIAACRKFLQVRRTADFLRWPAAWSVAWWGKIG